MPPRMPPVMPPPPEPLIFTPPPGMEIPPARSELPTPPPPVDIPPVVPPEMMPDLGGISPPIPTAPPAMPEPSKRGFFGQMIDRVSPSETPRTRGGIAGLVDRLRNQIEERAAQQETPRPTPPPPPMPTPPPSLPPRPIPREVARRSIPAIRGLGFQAGGEVGQDRRSAAFMRNLRSTAPGTMQQGIMPIAKQRQ